jgi:hypothetical protein
MKMDACTSPADLSREEKTELILQRSEALLATLGFAPTKEFVRRFLGKQPDSEVNRWFQLVVVGGAR